MITMRTGMVSIAYMLLVGCKPAPIEATACLVDKKLAFALADTDHWYGKTTARPSSVTVYATQKAKGEFWRGEPVWDSNADVSLLERIGLPIRTSNRTVTYGGKYPGWVETVAPQPLKSGHHYEVIIVTDGGYNKADFTAGDSLPQCSAIR